MTARRNNKNKMFWVAGCRNPKHQKAAPPPLVVFRRTAKRGTDISSSSIYEGILPEILHTAKILSSFKC